MSLNFFDALIKELDTKIDQLDTGMQLGHTPTRRELENFTWKTGRVIRQLVKPETSDETRTFWSECKGILKRVLVIEKFNPGVFVADCVREDMIERDLLSTLQKLRKYTQSRADGKIAAPKQALDEPGAKKVKVQETVKPTVQKPKWEELRNKWDAMPLVNTRWDDEESDVDEPCPDLAKTGTCAYGRQCGFCHRE